MWKSEWVSQNAALRFIQSKQGAIRTCLSHRNYTYKYTFSLALQYCELIINLIWFRIRFISFFQSFACECYLICTSLLFLSIFIFIFCCFYCWLYWPLFFHHSCGSKNWFSFWDRIRNSSVVRLLYFCANSRKKNRNYLKFYSGFIGIFFNSHPLSKFFGWKFGGITNLLHNIFYPFQKYKRKAVNLLAVCFGW